MNADNRSEKKKTYYGTKLEPDEPIDDEVDGETSGLAAEPETETHWHKIVFFALDLGKLLLENGAETYRVENTVHHLLESRGIGHIQTFVIPTGIFVAAEYNDESFSYVARVADISINLRVITRVNELSRDFVASDMSIRRATKRLDHIRTTKSYRPILRYIYGGLAAGLFTILFNGGVSELIVSTIVSAIVIDAMDRLDAIGVNYFIKNVLGGIVAAGTAILFSYAVETASATMGFAIPVDTNIVIIGAIMTLVPGVALTNAVRDSISGDFVSGMSRTTEAVIVALAIAFGVGIVINFAIAILGRSFI